MSALVSAGLVPHSYLLITRRYFQADQNDPVERFIAEAAQHPVFELTPTHPPTMA